MLAETQLAVLVAFIAFSLTASAGYIVNDIVDAEADRRHPAKRNRPVAAGRLATAPAGALAAVLMLGGVGLGFAALNTAFGSLLVVYLALTLAYSFSFKQILLVDVVVLAGLYALRLLAGGAAVGIEVSSWLMAFAMFFFLSVAFAKRFVELDTAGPESQGRAYRAVDREMIRAVGPACGLMSILVLALYITSEPVQAAYDEPRLLWLLCILMLYWILRVWFLAIRGALDHDPVVFTLRDGVSYAIAVGALVVLYLAA